MPADSDVITRDPLNVETSWDGLASALTPTSEFYTRNNFPIPQIAPQDWRLDVAGFERPLAIAYGEVQRGPQRTLDVVLECAGNSRTFFDPKPDGTAWRERAVACARFRGTPLGAFLERAGVPRGTIEIVFQGADGGTFERSLPLDIALADDTLLVWEMNGAPLVPKHGAPVRLLVPGWYGVASVKWLTRMRPSATPFRGHFQAERYVYARSNDDPSATPVREKRVNSMIASPTPDAVVRAGTPLPVRGWAWSGGASIARVEVSSDGGATWTEATLEEDHGPHAWRAWRWEFVPTAGPLVLVSRAHDAAGNVQPAHPVWNFHGYGYNAPRPRRVRVE